MVEEMGVDKFRELIESYMGDKLREAVHPQVPMPDILTISHAQQLHASGAGRIVLASQHSIVYQHLRHVQILRGSLGCARATSRCLTRWWVQYDDAFPRRDLVGVHPQKQEGLFWGCACVPAGRLHAEDFYDFARVADE